MDTAPVQAAVEKIWCDDECAYKVDADRFPEVLLVITNKTGIADGTFVLCAETQSGDWKYKSIAVAPGRENAKRVSMNKYKLVGFIPSHGDRMPNDHGKHVETDASGRPRNFSSAVWNTGFGKDGFEDRINIEIWRRWEGR